MKRRVSKGAKDAEFFRREQAERRVENLWIMIYSRTSGTGIYE